MTNCIEGTLVPYTPNADAPWNKIRVQHLYSRLSNGASIQEVTAGLQQTPGDLVDALIDEALTVPAPDETYFVWAQYPTIGGSTIVPADWPHQEWNVVERYHQLSRHFLRGLINDPVKYKLTLFWAGHFATETINFFVSYDLTYLYYQLLHQQAFGNVRTFVEKIGLNPKMLYYLNGRENVASSPNENYARELLELFTLGEGNYTQDDIENIARGLTGWYCGIYYPHYLAGEYATQQDEYFLHADDHDWEPIEVFGQTYTPQVPSNDQEAFDSAFAEYNWILDTIFEQKTEIAAKHLCRKLYKYYVYEIPNEDFVAELATVLIDNEWEITPVLRALFKSEHFFNENAFGIQIKSTSEMFAHHVRKMGYEYNVHWYSEKWALLPSYDPEHPYSNGFVEEDDHTNWSHANWFWSQSPGQHVLNPPNVAGWPGGRNWINESLMVRRWQVMIPTIMRFFGGWGSGDLVPTVLLLQHAKDWMKELTDNSTDVEFVVREVLDHYLVMPLDEEIIQECILVFKGTVYPESYYTDEIWNLDLENSWIQLRNLLAHVCRLPEFHLA